MHGCGILSGDGEKMRACGMLYVTGKRRAGVARFPAPASRLFAVVPVQEGYDLGALAVSGRAEAVS